MPHRDPAARDAFRAQKRQEHRARSVNEPLVRRRLLAKVIAGPKGCWLWTGAKNPRGYGNIGVHYRTRLAHRVSYEIFVGPIPEGLTLDHLCDTPACINPRHLTPATDRENILRGTSASANNARKTRCKYGHALTPENVYLFRGKWRACRECNRQKARRNYAKKKAARA